MASVNYTLYGKKEELRQMDSILSWISIRFPTLISDLDLDHISISPKKRDCVMATYNPKLKILQISGDKIYLLKESIERDISKRGLEIKLRKKRNQ